jgi:catechol 2,3-dioxygenase-like lactoylglutathione lyase family enzyme
VAVHLWAWQRLLLRRHDRSPGKISVYIWPCAVEHHASCDYTQLSFEQEPVMPAPFNIVKIDHVVLRAADPTKLERFYLDALGLTFEKRQGELAQLRAGNALIDIVPADEAGPAGGTSSTGGANLDHLCLRIEPFDRAAITKHLTKHHVACGAETLRYGAEGEGPSIYLRDPEGNGIELKGPASGR